MKVESVAEKMFFTTCRVEAQSPEKTWVGTGFVYEVATREGPVHFLVTNRHVLSGASTITVRFVRLAESGGPWLGNATQVTVSGLDHENWLGHPHPEIDVAVMPLGQILDEMTRNGSPAFFAAVTPEICQGIGSHHRFDAIEEVAFVGYPAGLFDEKNYLPMVRRGTTATPIDVPYRGLPAFLIDAAVFPGSSGSPVFVSDRGLYSDRLGEVVTVGNRVACLGIVAAVHASEVEAVLGLPSANLVATFKQPLGLGVVYGATCFDECAQVLLDRSGFERIQQPPSGDGAPSGRAL